MDKDKVKQFVLINRYQCPMTQVWNKATVESGKAAEGEVANYFGISNDATSRNRWSRNDFETKDNVLIEVKTGMATGENIRKHFKKKNPQILTFTPERVSEFRLTGEESNTIIYCYRDVILVYASVSSRAQVERYFDAIQEVKNANLEVGNAADALRNADIVHVQTSRGKVAGPVALSKSAPMYGAPKGYFSAKPSSGKISASAAPVSRQAAGGGGPGGPVDDDWATYTASKKPLRLSFGALSQADMHVQNLKDVRDEEARKLRAFEKEMAQQAAQRARQRRRDEEEEAARDLRAAGHNI